MRTCIFNNGGRGEQRQNALGDLRASLEGRKRKWVSDGGGAVRAFRKQDTAAICTVGRTRFDGPTVVHVVSVGG
eukprot:10740886-Alexandrium_andersonii.AAC.1